MRDQDWIETAIQAINAQIQALSEARDRLEQLKIDKNRPQYPRTRKFTGYRPGSLPDRIIALLRASGEPLDSIGILAELRRNGHGDSLESIRVALHRLRNRETIEINPKGFAFLVADEADDIIVDDEVNQETKTSPRIMGDEEEGPHQ